MMEKPAIPPERLPPDQATKAYELRAAPGSAAADASTFDSAANASSTGTPPAATGEQRPLQEHQSTVPLAGAGHVPAPNLSGMPLPRQIGEYQILAEIARGGMGVVYKGRHLALQRLAAIKLMRSGQTAGSDELRRFQLEAAAAAQLDHPSIVPVYELGEHQGQPYLAMALVEGQSLWQQVQSAPLEPRHAAEVMVPVCLAVEFAHQHGIIHRDLKPQNILCGADGLPRVTDFGLAKRTAVDSSLTATGQVLGTPSFMPPEQARGDDLQVGHRSDVYALGATLYCLLTGRPPFQSAHPVETLRQVIEQDPVAPRSLNPHVPRDLETICLKCLQKAPERRYSSAAEVADELTRFLSGLPILARPVGRWQRAARWCARNPVVAFLSSTAVLLLLAVAIVSSWAYVSQSRLLGEKDKLLTEKQTLLGDKSRLADAERQQRQEAERQLYNSQLARSAAELDRGNVVAAQTALFGLPLEGRNWEHRYLARRALGTPLELEGQPGPIYAAAFSPDGLWIASGGGDRLVHIWNATTGTEERRLQGHQHLVWSLAWNHSGTQLATSGPDGTVRIWNPHTGEEVHELDVRRQPVWSLAYNPDDLQLAGGTVAGTVLFWDAATGIEQASFIAGPGEVRGLAWHPQGQEVAVAITSPRGGQGQIKRCQCDNGQALESFDSLGIFCQTVQYTRDGTRLMAPTADGLKLWEIAPAISSNSSPSNSSATSEQPPVSGSSPAKPPANRPHSTQLKGHSDTVQCISVSPSGGMIATGSFDGTVRIWDPRQTASLTTLLGHQGRLHAVGFNEMGTRLVTASASATGLGELKVWNVPEAVAANRWRGHTNRVNFLEFSPDGRLVASGSNDRTVRLWDAPTGLLLKNLSGLKASVGSLGFSPSGKLVYASSMDARQTAELKIWHVETGQEFWTITDHNGWISEASIDSADHLIATCSSDQTVKIWDLTSKKLHSQLPEKIADLLGVHLAADGQSLVVRTGGNNKPGKETHWNLSDWQTRPLISTEVGEAISCYDDQHTRVATLSPDGTIHLRDAENGQLLASLRGHRQDVVGLVFSPDGSRLFSSSNDLSLKVWDTATARELLTIPVDVQPIALAIDPGGELLICGLVDNTILALESALDWQECRLRGHTAAVESLFSAPGNLLATRDSSGEQLVWDLATGGRWMDKVAEDSLRPWSESSAGEGLRLLLMSDDPTVVRLLRRLPRRGESLWSEDLARRQAHAPAWHETEAGRAEKAKDWYAAAFHWQQRSKLDPLLPDAQKRLEAARAELKNRGLPFPSN